MIFPLKLPLPLPLLYLQLWDFDLFKYNDCLAETTLDLSEACRKYEENTQACLMSLISFVAVCVLAEHTARGSL